jgi:hypothetical protein
MQLSTLLWDGRDWHQQSGLGGPAPIGHAMAFDAARATLVLFGGSDTNVGASAYTWTLR